MFIQYETQQAKLNFKKILIRGKSLEKSEVLHSLWLLSVRSGPLSLISAQKGNLGKLNNRGLGLKKGLTEDIGEFSCQNN